jgi:3-oxoacid CoA-transferase B subunit
MVATKQPLTRDQMAAILAQHIEDGWIVNLGIGIPTGVSNFIRPEQEVVFTSENGVIGYGRLAGEGEGDPDIVNAAAVQQVILNPGASIVHHADSFALIRRGLVDVTCLGAYEVAPDGSFANWKTTTEPWNHLGGIGGAMDLAACSKRVYVAMEHTTRDGQPRLVERCSLPVTAPAGVVLVVTNVAVVAVRDGRFILEQCAPGYEIEEIVAMTGAPLDVSPDVRPVAV